MGSQEDFKECKSRTTVPSRTSPSSLEGKNLRKILHRSHCRSLLLRYPGVSRSRGAGVGWQCHQGPKNQENHSKTCPVGHQGMKSSTLSSRLQLQVEELFHTFTRICFRRSQMEERGPSRSSHKLASQNFAPFKIEIVH